MRAHLTLAFALLLLCSGAALASTPDGETPAEETVCDSETGAAYGLCNAYCEAMDCDSDNPSASETACSKVQDKFRRITGRDLPCEVPELACPCADPGFPVFPDLLAGQISAISCEVFGDSVRLGLSGGGTAFSETPVAVSPASCGVLPTASLTITLEQAQFCSQLLIEAANSQGISCDVY